MEVREDWGGAGMQAVCQKVQQREKLRSVIVEDVPPIHTMHDVDEAPESLLFILYLN